MASIEDKNGGEIGGGILDEQSQKPQVPSKLPVLLLRDVVIFPYMIAPLFVGREKSKNAIDIALSTNRMILLLTQKDMEVEAPKREDVYDVGTVALILRMLKLPDGRVRILAQGLVRAKVQSFEEDGAHITAEVAVMEEPEKPETGPRDRGAHPQRPVRARAGGLARQEPAARGPHLRPEHRRAGPPGGPDRLQPRAQGRGGPVHPRDRRPLPAPQEGLRAADPGARAPGRPVEDLDRGQGRDGQAPEAVFPAPADEGHPEGARRGQRDPGGDPDLPGEAAQDPRLRRGQGGAREADQPPGPDAPGIGRDLRRPQLPRLDVHAALEQVHDGHARPGQGQEDPRRRPLRPGEGQGAHPRVPGRPEALQDDQGAHPVLRRPARRGQDLARQVHRPGPRPEVRPHLARRRPRRGRDPGPSPDLRRGHARPHHPGHPPGGHRRTPSS